VEAATVFEPAREPYRVIPEIVDALIVFDPARDPYRVAPEMVEAFTVLAPRIRPHTVPTDTLPRTLRTTRPVSSTQVFAPTHKVRVGATLAMPTLVVVVKAAYALVNLAMVVAEFPRSRTLSRVCEPVTPMVPID
jgi:hypothetical protein